MPTGPVGSLAWVQHLAWRLSEDTFLLVHQTRDYPVVNTDLLADLRRRADDLLWLVEYLEEAARL